MPKFMLFLKYFRIAIALIEENVILLRRRKLKMLMKSQKMNLTNLWGVISIPMDFSFSQESDQILTVSQRGRAPYSSFSIFRPVGTKNRNWAQIAL